MKPLLIGGWTRSLFVARLGGELREVRLRHGGLFEAVNPTGRILKAIFLLFSAAREYNWEKALLAP